MPKPHRESSTRALAWAQLGLVGLACILAPLMVGSVFPSTAVVLFGLAFLSLIATLEYSRRRQTELRASSLTPAFLLVAGWCALQILPLPLGVLATVAPSVHEIYTLGHQAAFGEVPEASRPVSLAPTLTADRGLRFLTLAVLAFVVANIRDRGQAWRLGTLAVVSSALLSLAVGIVHTSFDMQSFYGIYEALIAPKLGTFVSSNHTASLAGVAALVAFAYAFRRAGETSDSRVTVGASIAGVLLLVFMLQGESAAVGLLFLIATIVFGISMLRDARQRRLGFGLGAGALTAAGTAVILLRESITNSSIGRWLFDSLEVRIELATAALKAASDFTFFGSGAGTTDHMIYPYVELSHLRATRLVTLENEPFEWLFTLGVPVALVCIAGIVIPVVMVRANSQDSDRRRFFVAVFRTVWVFLGGIALVHFPFLALGVAIPAVVVVEAIARQTFHLHRTDDSPWVGPFLYLSRRTTLIGCSMALVLGLILSFNAFGSKSPKTFVEVPDDPARAIRATPGQARLYVSLARDARQSQDWERQRELTERAVALEPRDSLKLLHAFALYRADDVTDALALWKDVADNGTSTARMSSDLVRYLPNDPELIARITYEASPEVWQRVARELTRRDPLLCARFAVELVELRPDSPVPYELVVDAYRHAQLWDVAEAWATYLIASGDANEQGPIGWGLYVETLQRRGQRERALNAARQAMRHVPGDPRVTRVVLSLRNPDPSTAAADEVDQVSAAYDHYCAAAATGARRALCRSVKAWLAEASGDVESAETIYKARYRASQDPRELGRFYHRAGRCMAIRSLMATQDAESHTRALEALYRQCVN